MLRPITPSPAPPGYYSSPTITGGQATSQSNPNPAPYSTNSGTGYYGATVTGTGLSCGGQIETKWTWSANSPTAPVPQQVIIKQFSNATWQSSTASGKCDDGLGDAAVPAQGGGGATSSGTHYSMAPADAKGNVTVDCTPSASISASSCGVSYQPTLVSPVIITLGGTTPDSSGNPNILVGQKCSATLSGIPSGGGWSATYQWSVSGTTFQTWQPTTPALPNANPPTQANSQASYYNGGPVPATNPTSWYWNDPLTSPATATETVSCTAMVTPPAGQGPAFSVTATQNVIVQVPSWTATGTGGYMQVNAKCDGLNVISLYAGPTKGTSYVGVMNFSLTVYTPQTPAFGNGQIELVQTVTPVYTYVTNTSPPQNHAFPQNNLNGLDGAYPYKGFSTPETNEDDPTDSPNIPLASTTATATLQDTFKDYLMYEPPNSTQFVPLATFTWSANGTASSSTGDWAHYTGPTGTDAVGGTVSDPNTTTPFTPDKGGTDFPSWPLIIKSVPF